MNKYPIETEVFYDGELWNWKAIRKIYHVWNTISSGKADTKRKAIRRMNKHIKECVSNAYDGNISELDGSSSSR